jgi:hypothetical protein
MKNFSAVWLFFLLAALPFQVNSWGFWAHKRINRIAVFTLPPQLLAFYKANIEYITEQAVGPDKRRYSNPDEAPRHYIDLDKYGVYPYTELPRRWTDAVAKFSADTLKAHGIVPWHTLNVYYDLIAAFQAKDKRRILRLSADIGHYIGDAHVPLHCTKNYNGQLTNQVGIHGFWESRIPELFGDDYDYFIGKAEFVESPFHKIWEVVLASASQVDSVLNLEREISRSFPPDLKYSFDQRGETSVRSYSQEFSAAYQQALNGMQERKMRQAIITLGSIWYTAWVTAGKPDLGNLTESEMSDEEKAEYEELDKNWRAGKIIGRPEE